MIVVHREYRNRIDASNYDGIEWKADGGDLIVKWVSMGVYACICTPVVSIRGTTVHVAVKAGKPGDATEISVPGAAAFHIDSTEALK